MRAEFSISVRGGRSTLAGRVFTTYLKNKNVSSGQKTLEETVPVIFFLEFCNSPPDKKCYDHPVLKFLCVYMDFLDRTELLVRSF